MNTGNLSGGASMIALGATMSPAERAQGRFMRAPDGHEMGGGEAPADNGGENAGNSTNRESGGNNAGQQFNPVAFWDDPEQSEAASPGNGKSADSESGGSGSPNEGGLGAAIASQVSGFNSGDVMTKEAIEKIGEGDYSSFNTNLSKAMQGSMEKVVGMNVKIMEAFGTQLMQKMEGMISSSHTSKDNRNALREAVPSSKNPAVQPIIDSIYDRALVLSKGDTTKAINMTKSMLASMANETGKDVDLNVAPVGSDSELPIGGGAKINWLEALNSAG